MMLCYSNELKIFTYDLIVILSECIISATSASKVTETVNEHVVTARDSKRPRRNILQTIFLIIFGRFPPFQLNKGIFG